MSDARRTYRFGPLERRSLFGALRAGQAGVLVLAGLLALLIISTLESDLGAVLAITQFLVLSAAALISFGGRTADEWGPLLIAFAARRLTGRLRWRSPLSHTGHRAKVRARPSGHSVLPPQPVLPPPLRGVELIEIDYRDGQIGALYEPGEHRITGVIACRARAFALLDPDAQERRLDRWGSLLTSVADGPIRRLQWLERTTPARADELSRWLHDARDPALPPRGAPIVESYLELISTDNAVANAHEILLAIQVDTSRGASRRNPGPQQTLIEQLERVAGALTNAEITVLGAMAAGPLARSLRTSFDPFSAGELHDWSSVRGPAGVARHEQAPMATLETWDHYRCDGAQHASFWIAEWPKVDVSPMFLDPVLSNSRIVRTVAVTMAPISPERSAREVEAAVTRDHADRELRARFGQTETARQRQMQESARRREAELAAGHCEMRLSGFITVSGRNEQELRVACNECRQQATQARLGLHRLYGQQAEAFTFTLPLARGLR